LNEKLIWNQSLKEDILEQLIEDWLVAKPGWFVKHNVKFRPDKIHKKFVSKKDSVHSDIDIIAFSNKEKHLNRVKVVSCKSWQGGFIPTEWLRNLESEASYNEKTAKFQTE